MKRLILLLVSASLFLSACGNEKEPQENVQVDTEKEAAEEIETYVRKIENQTFEDEHITFTVNELLSSESGTRIEVTIVNKTDETLKEYMNKFTINDITYDFLDMQPDSVDDLGPNETLVQGYNIDDYTDVEKIEYLEFDYHYWNYSKTIQEWNDLSFELK